VSGEQKCRPVRRPHRSHQRVPPHPSYNPGTIDGGGTGDRRPCFAPEALLVWADGYLAVRVAGQSAGTGIPSISDPPLHTGAPVGDIQRKPYKWLDAAGSPGNRRKIHRTRTKGLRQTWGSASAVSSTSCESEATLIVLASVAVLPVKLDKVSRQKLPKPPYSGK
jgi:hypothetical protein